jgi:SAM-dependent methyltransferase
MMPSRTDVPAAVIPLWQYAVGTNAAIAGLGVCTPATAGRRAAHASMVTSTKPLTMREKKRFSLGTSPNGRTGAISPRIIAPRRESLRLSGLSALALETSTAAGAADLYFPSNLGTVAGMCNRACLEFGRRALTAADIQGRSILDVGARDVNGSLRASLERFAPASYLGTDIEAGPGVDEICDISALVRRYGAGRFDVVISTEVIEHVRAWRSAISNLKRVLKPGGLLLVTTRSRGFPYHGYPYDFWRYEVDDMRLIFSDMQLDAVDPDPGSPGVLVKARKPFDFAERELASLRLYSIIRHRRCLDVTTAAIYLRRVRHRTRRVLARLLPDQLLSTIDRAVTGQA